jgi:hypothetical protein
MGQFATNMQNRIGALERGEAADLAGAAPASGFGIALQAARLAISRVLRRFFLPFDPARV